MKYIMAVCTNIRDDCTWPSSASS